MFQQYFSCCLLYEQCFWVLSLETNVQLLFKHWWRAFFSTTKDFVKGVNRWSQKWRYCWVAFGRILDGSSCTERSHFVPSVGLLLQFKFVVTTITATLHFTWWATIVRNWNIIYLHSMLKRRCNFWIGAGNIITSGELLHRYKINLQIIDSQKAMTESNSEAQNRGYYYYIQYKYIQDLIWVVIKYKVLCNN